MCSSPGFLYHTMGLWDNWNVVLTFYFCCYAYPKIPLKFTTWVLLVNIAESKVLCIFCDLSYIFWYQQFLLAMTSSTSHHRLFSVSQWINCLCLFSPTFPLFLLKSKHIQSLELHLYTCCYSSCDQPLYLRDSNNCCPFIYLTNIYWTWTKCHTLCQILWYLDSQSLS